MRKREQLVDETADVDDADIPTPCSSGRDGGAHLSESRANASPQPSPSREISGAGLLSPSLASSMSNRSLFGGHRTTRKPAKVSRFSKASQATNGSEMKYCATGARDYRRTNIMKTLLNTPNSVDGVLMHVERGQVLRKYPQSGTPGSCGAKLARIRNACWPARELFFVVLHATGGNEPPVLQWARTEAQATSDHPEGRVLVGDVTYAAASLTNTSLTTPSTPDSIGIEEDCLEHGDSGKWRMCCCRRRRSRKELEFSVVYGVNKLKLCAEDRYSLENWVMALNVLKSQEQAAALSAVAVTPQKHFINQHMARSSTGPDAKAADLRKMAIAMSVHKDRRTLLMNSSETLNTDKVAKLFDDHIVQSLKPWFEKYATAQTCKRVMSAEDFRLFLQIDQRETAFFDSPTIEGLFQNLTDPYVVDHFNERFLTFEGFCRVICCAENALFDPERRARVDEREMNRPLAEYWISTSHNTYLEDDQLLGSSSLEQYVDVLLRGCRCVEIDCWDGEDGEPMVTHGRTLTSSLRFEDVVRVCRDYAFVASPYPLILSLEVRCGHAQKERMAQILQEVLGDMLLNSDPQADPSITPQKARKKIIIKSRELKQKSKRETWRGKHGSQWSASVAPQVSEASRASGESKDVEEEVEGADLKTGGTADSPQVVYLASRKLRNISEKDPRSCISLNEDKALAFIRQRKADGTRQFCMEQLMRIYPKPTRIGSGNFDPMPLWLAGFQMVALNYQILGLPILLNEGLFSHENGGAGYILKPPLVHTRREGPAQLSHLCSLSLEDEISFPLECELTILSGHRLGRRESRYSNSVVSPKVRVTICGAEGDGRTMETHRIEGEGYEPRWHRHFQLQVREPTVAMLVFEVINASEGALKWSKLRAESLLAYTAFPVSGLREGLRWVPLMDYRHHSLEYSGLLVEVRYRGAWAEEMRQRLDRKNWPKWGEFDEKGEFDNRWSI